MPGHAAGAKRVPLCGGYKEQMSPSAVIQLQTESGTRATEDAWPGSGAPWKKSSWSHFASV